MPIRRLPPEVASQIAAGEVVERPASVVKELLENGLDAGAGFIALGINGAGKNLIEVSDDGWGIPEDDLPIALERHATSKITTADELFNIGTLGFRGEALASISSVARVTITSRTIESPHAARLVVEGGKMGSIERIGAPIGTKVRVEDLFYNLPARLKFLKSDLTEKRHIDNTVTRYALAYPNVRIHHHQDGKPVFHTSGNGDRREVLATLYGADFARKMLEVLSATDRMSLTGFVSPIALSRSNRREITFFVNGRPIQDVALTTALIKAYHTLLMVGRYPLAVLFIDIPPEEVDVNVHPTKAEIRFRDPSKVFAAVQNAVRRALLVHTPVSSLSISTGKTQFDFESSGSRWDTGWGTQTMAGEPGSDGEFNPADKGPAPLSLSQAEQTGWHNQIGTPILRLIGQIAATYLVAEGPDGLYLIDQHAAHERILFEEFIAQKQGSIPSQTLLQPLAVDLPPASARLMIDQLPVIKRLGFQIEEFGPGTFLVRSIPALLSGVDPGAAVRVIVEDFEEDETPLQSELEARLIARVCKRAAIKGGQVLAPEEQRELLAGLEKCQSPRTCPHGRPTMIHLSVDLLERQFGRKGARG